MPGNASLLVSYKPLDNLGYRGASQPGKLPLPCRFTRRVSA